jgi:hypothetical protein
MGVSAGSPSSQNRSSSTGVLIRSSAHAGGGGSGKADGGGCNSFVPGTKVLMTEGSTKAKEKVEVGDKVVADRPQDRETRTETVSAEIKGKGLKHLVKVTIDVDAGCGEIGTLCDLESRGLAIGGSRTQSIDVRGGSQGYGWDRHGVPREMCPNCRVLFTYLLNVDH